MGYFMQGLPATWIMTTMTVLFKNFDFSNTTITFYTSLLAIPLFLKPFFAPLMEFHPSRKSWIISMSSCMIILLILLTAIFSLDNFFYPSLIVLLLFAFAASFYDMHLDGLYMIALDKPMQTQKIGFRTFSFHLGNMTGQSGLVLLTGILFTFLTIQYGIFYLDSHSQYKHL